jgi:hypothetical protein
MERNQPEVSDEQLPPLPEPALLKLPDGEFDDDVPVKWAWFAHGYDTGMEPYFTADQVREAQRAAILALATPKGEPLTQEQIMAEFRAICQAKRESGKPGDAGFTDGVRFAERYHATPKEAQSLVPDGVREAFLNFLADSYPLYTGEGEADAWIFKGNVNLDTFAIALGFKGAHDAVDAIDAPSHQEAQNRKDDHA